MGFRKTLIALAAVSSVIATPALAGAERLSVVAQPAAKGVKNVRANTSMRKSSKVAPGGYVIAVGAAIAAGLGIAAAAGAFDPSDSN